MWLREGDFNAFQSTHSLDCPNRKVTYSSFSTINKCQLEGYGYLQNNKFYKFIIIFRTLPDVAKASEFLKAQLPIDNYKLEIDNVQLRLVLTTSDDALLKIFIESLVIVEYHFRHVAPQLLQVLNIR